MQVVGSFNNLSAEAKKEVRSLEPKQEAIFEFIDGEFNSTDPSRKLFGGARSYSLRDKYYDNGSKTWVEIGVPRTIDLKNNVVLKVRKLSFTGGGENGQVSPRFSLNGSNPEQAMIYQFLSIAPSFKSIVREVDRTGEAKTTNKKAKILKEALFNADNLGIKDIRMLCAARNINTEGVEDEVLRSYISDLAMTQPEEFMKLVGDESSTFRAYVKIAQETGIITYDIATHSVKWPDGSTVAELDRIEGKQWNELFANWTASHKNGGSVYAKLKTEVDKRMIEKQKGEKTPAGKKEE